MGGGFVGRPRGHVGQAVFCAAYGHRLDRDNVAAGGDSCLRYVRCCRYARHRSVASSRLERHMPGGSIWTNRSCYPCSPKTVCRGHMGRQGVCLPPLLRRRNFAPCQFNGCMHQVTTELVLRELDRLLSDRSMGTSSPWRIVCPDENLFGSNAFVVLNLN